MTSADLTHIYEPIQAELDAAKKVVSSSWTQVLRLVHGPDMPPPEMGGKFLRPALCLLSAGAIGVRDISRFEKLAAAYETLHLAALVRCLLIPLPGC